ncbi:unnamed protein product [Hermetia illucens]|uniref:Brain protein I3 n=1 Tax=Hermetia illucens TaxID=343691 RepID=A0A7R8URZ6_HERIL|nr:unnamed protein product [Hermetia illucens]
MENVPIMKQPPSYSETTGPPPFSSGDNGQQYYNSEYASTPSATPSYIPAPSTTTHNVTVVTAGGPQVIMGGCPVCRNSTILIANSDQEKSSINQTEKSVERTEDNITKGKENSPASSSLNRLQV